MAAGWPAASVEDSERRKAAPPSPSRAGVAIEKKILNLHFPKGMFPKIVVP